MQSEINFHVSWLWFLFTYGTCIHFILPYAIRTNTNVTTCPIGHVGFLGQTNYTHFALFLLLCYEPWLFLFQFPLFFFDLFFELFISLLLSFFALYFLFFKYLFSLNGYLFHCFKIFVEFFDFLETLRLLFRFPFFDLLCQFFGQFEGFLVQREQNETFFVLKFRLGKVVLLLMDFGHEVSDLQIPGIDAKALVAVLQRSFSVFEFIVNKRHLLQSFRIWLVLLKAEKQIVGWQFIRTSSWKCDSHEIISFGSLRIVFEYLLKFLQSIAIIFPLQQIFH